jgi:hypothetical protein
MGGHEVVGRTSLKHARKMVYRGVARVHTWQDKDALFGLGIPRSIELNKYIFARWLFSDHSSRRVFSKKGVLKRDGYLCAYCANKATTIDHVIPRARGGQSNWLNCVAACVDCNRRKRDYLLEEIDMELLSPPFIP